VAPIWSRNVVLAGLVGVDLAGAAVAQRNRVAGEPLGVGASLDVTRPMTLTLWGSGLSAPLISLGALVAFRRHPSIPRIMGVLFALGALAEPAFWGRRGLPRYGRPLLFAHVTLAGALAAIPFASRRRLTEP
jgi:hypothetical protein